MFQITQKVVLETLWLSEVIVQMHTEIACENLCPITKLAVWNILYYITGWPTIHMVESTKLYSVTLNEWQQKAVTSLK